MSEIVVALFALACGYACGRADRLDLEPWWPRRRLDVDWVICQALARQRRRTRRLQLIRRGQGADGDPGAVESGNVAPEAAGSGSYKEWADPDSAA